MSPQEMHDEMMFTMTARDRVMFAVALLLEVADSNDLTVSAEDWLVFCTSTRGPDAAAALKTLEGEAP